MRKPVLENESRKEIHATGIMPESDRKQKKDNILSNARHIVNQSISSLEETRNYISQNSVKSAPKFEQAQDSEESNSAEKVDVSKVVKPT